MWCVVCTCGALRVQCIHTMLIHIVPSQTHFICPHHADVPATPALASLLSHVACPLVHHTMPTTPIHLSVTPMHARPPHGDQPVFSPANNPFTSLLPLHVTRGPSHIPPTPHAMHVRQGPLQHELRQDPARHILPSWVTYFEICVTLSLFCFTNYDCACTFGVSLASNDLTEYIGEWDL